MRLTVNGSDISQFVRRDILVGWQFSDSPGSLSYTPPAQIELGIPHASDLNPSNVSSPLSVDNAMVSISLDEYTFLGTLKSAIRQSPSVIQLNISDDLQSKLQFQTVVGSWEGTPAHIARQILISYGILVNLNTFSTCVAAQDSAGLQFRYTLNIAEDVKLQDALGILAKAGWMRIAIWNGMTYAIQGIPEIPILSVPGFVIDASDLWGLPSERERSDTITSGGTVKWSVNSVVVESTDSRFGQFTEDYSQNPILDNSSGAYYLISSNATLPRKSFELPVKLSYALQFRPGDWITIEKGIFGPSAATVQLVGVKIESTLKAVITVEVAQWIA